MSGKRYQSGYDDGFKAGQWAGRVDLLALLREARDALVAVAKGGKAVADELMAEFISKTRAANWGIINKGLIACDAALRTIMKLDAVLTEAPKAEPQEGKEGV